LKLLVDRCAGRRVADWLRQQGHDVREAREQIPDPGDAALLRAAASEDRVLVTIDTDFGTLVFLGGLPHAGVIRLPDVPAPKRIALMEQILTRYGADALNGAIVTATETRIRYSRP
jgi:predicted nuclease of predicted toxin-antitoxin system